MHRIRAVAVFPTIFTLGNLVCGFFAIVAASRIARPGDETFSTTSVLTSEAPDAVGGASRLTATVARPSPKLDSLRELFRSLDPTHNLMLCGGLIFLAMLFDMFDGQVARMARVTSDFGAQLDSLCDLVSFGVAPAILLVKMCPQFAEIHRESIWFIAALFACCAAMRLARFNVEADEDDDHSWFEGLPSPAAAAVVASFAMFSYTLRNEMNAGKEIFESFDWWMQRLLPPAALAIGLLMVSRIPYPHLVTQMLRGQKSFPQLVAIVFALMALVAVGRYAIPLLCGVYAIAPPVWHVWRWHAERHSRGAEDHGERDSRVFTGLVQSLATVDKLTPAGPGVRMVLHDLPTAARAGIGDSMAINGCCLTVVEASGGLLSFDAGSETLSRHNLGAARSGDRVNLETSLRMGDQLGGHLVSGHIDGLGAVAAREDDGEWTKMWFRVPADLMRQMASKGSIAVDGVSLTLVDVTNDRFSVALIPHTLSATTLGLRKVGDAVNLETDLLAKYVERQLAGTR